MGMNIEVHKRAINLVGYILGMAILVAALSIAGAIILMAIGTGMFWLSQNILWLFWLIVGLAFVGFLYWCAYQGVKNG